MPIDSSFYCRFKGLSIESDNGDVALKFFEGQRRLGIIFWVSPYPKIGGGRIYSGFSHLRDHPPTFTSLHLLGLELKTCGNRTVRGLPGRYSPFSNCRFIFQIYVFKTQVFCNSLFFWVFFPDIIEFFIYLCKIIIYICKN